MVTGGHGDKRPMTNGAERRAGRHANGAEGLTGCRRRGGDSVPGSKVEVPPGYGMPIDECSSIES
jgi:hypothetical protein